MTDGQASKRELLKKAAYVAPAILTLRVVPSFASSGSGLNEEATEERVREKEKEKSNNGVWPNSFEEKEKKQKNKD